MGVVMGPKHGRRPAVAMGGRGGGRDVARLVGRGPPNHAPVCVLTHDAHEAVGMERAFETAGDSTATIAGGASAVPQCVAGRNAHRVRDVGLEGHTQP